MISIQLNSFVRRVDDKERILALALKEECRLKRIRRSRHWQLSGTELQLNHFKAGLIDIADYWIKQAVEKALPKKQLSLQECLLSQPNITVNQLVAETECTVAEARQAIDQFEQLD